MGAGLKNVINATPFVKKSQKSHIKTNVIVNILYNNGKRMIS